MPVGVGHGLVVAFDGWNHALKRALGVVPRQVTKILEQFRHIFRKIVSFEGVNLM